PLHVLRSNPASASRCPESFRATTGTRLNPAAECTEVRHSRFGQRRTDWWSVLRYSSPVEEPKTERSCDGPQAEVRMGPYQTSMRHMQRSTRAINRACVT